MSVRILEGDCLAVMPTLDADSIDAIVTDPPYHLTAGKKGGTGVASLNADSPAGRSRVGTGFMGKAWDGGDVAFRPELWVEALRVAKPGAHLVAFGGTRTFHRLTCAIEDAGWEIRDCLSWLYGSGFPKSLNVGKQLDKYALQFGYSRDAALAHMGYGTALKPAWEPIILARKPLGQSVAANVLEHSTGALNIDETRIPSEAFKFSRGATALGQMNDDGWQPKPQSGENHPSGRWPANVVLDEEAAAILDKQSGNIRGCASVSRPEGGKNEAAMFSPGPALLRDSYGDSGGASRFFYTAKSSRAEREAGLEDFPTISPPDGRDTEHHVPNLRTSARQNHHPTVKPLDLMQWLCRLVTPKGGLILDPFCGSGTTGRAAVAEGFQFIGIELDPEYAAIARARIAEYAPLFGDVA